MAAAGSASKTNEPSSPSRSGSILKLPSLPAWATSRASSPSAPGAVNGGTGAPAEIERGSKLGSTGTRKSALASTSRASPLPNGRFIPESERGWVYDDAGAALAAQRGAGDRRRSSLASKQWLDILSSSSFKTKSGQHAETSQHPPLELTRTRSRSTPAVSLAGGVAEKMRADYLSAAASRAAPVMADDDAEWTEQTGPQRSLARFDAVVEEEAARPASREPSFDASADAEQAATSQRRRRRRRSLQEASQSEAMYDEQDLKNSSRSHRLQLDTDVSATTLPGPQQSLPDESSRTDAAVQSGPRVAGSQALSPIESPPPAVHTSRGYPWRDMTTSSSKAASALPTFVSPSHRNPTAKQAFYDTHFGASSGWQSLSSLAEPVRHPWDTLRGKRKSAKVSSTPGSTERTKEEREQAIKQHQQSTSILNAGTTRIKEMLSGWNGLTSLGVLGPSSMSNEGAHTDSSGSPTSPSVATTNLAAAYEPELIPTVQKNPNAKRYFDNIEGNVVIMGGYRGSVLRDATTGQMLWIPIKVR